MKLRSETFPDRGMMPKACAFGAFQTDGTVVFCENRNPQLSWHDLPSGTKSLALINDDLDVPMDVASFNKAGEVVSRSQDRRSLCHWVLIDLPPDGQIGFGEFSDGAVVGGKPGPDGPRETRQGLNEYTDWFLNDPIMAGKYFGYDGPCPPYNDEIAHRYVFTLYAIDVERLRLDSIFNKQAALKMMADHVLASASITGLFSSNHATVLLRN